jgi:hypothetical protein
MYRLSLYPNRLALKSMKQLLKTKRFRNSSSKLSLSRSRNKQGVGGAVAKGAKGIGEGVGAAAEGVGTGVGTAAEGVGSGVGSAFSGGAAPSIASAVVCCVLIIGAGAFAMQNPDMVKGAAKGMKGMKGR